MLKTLNLLSAASSRTKQARLFCLSTIALIGIAALPVSQNNHSVTANATMVLVSKPAEIQKCVGCHGADLKGRVGFSPGLTRSGILKIYKIKTFEVVMNTGKTPHGGLVKPPMPVFHEKASVSDSMFKYLSTLK